MNDDLRRQLLDEVNRPEVDPARAVAVGARAWRWRGAGLYLAATMAMAVLVGVLLTIRPSAGVAHGGPTPTPTTVVVTVSTVVTTTQTKTPTSPTSSSSSTAVISLQRLVISPSSVTVAPQATQALSLTGVYSDGTSQPMTSGVTWSSTDDTVAAVDPTGVVTGAQAGSATVTASAGGRTASVRITVASALVSISLDPPKFSTSMGGPPVQVVAIGHYQDGTSHDITTLVTWSSSMPKVATVDAQGIVTAQAPGVATITAQSGAISEQTTAEVASGGPS